MRNFRARAPKAAPRAQRARMALPAAMKGAAQPLSQRAFGGVAAMQPLCGRAAPALASAPLSRGMATFYDDYAEHVAERAELGVVPAPLDKDQVAGLCEELKAPAAGKEAFLLDLLENRVPPGVDEAAYVKASFLAAVSKGEVSSPIVSKEHAAYLLGTMVGGYNITPMVELLDDPELAQIAADGLKKTLLMFDVFHDVAEKATGGNSYAKEVMQSWADAEWFLGRPKPDEKITQTVFFVSGETNTDDLSPAPDAWSRPDIPVHGLAMLKMERDGIVPDVPGTVGPLKQMEELKKKGFPLAYVGDVVGTGSSRKSATNSVLWFMGDDVPYIPNKRGGGVCIGGKIAPIFFNTMEDSGALPIEMDVAKLKMGTVIDIFPYEGVVKDHETGEVLGEFELKTNIILDEVRAGGRIPLIIGRGLTTQARESLGLPPSDVFQINQTMDKLKGYSLAQKMVGRACGYPVRWPRHHPSPYPILTAWLVLGNRRRAKACRRTSTASRR